MVIINHRISTSMSFRHNDNRYFLINISPGHMDLSCDKKKGLVKINKTSIDIILKMRTNIYRENNY